MYPSSSRASLWPDMLSLYDRPVDRGERVDNHKDVIHVTTRNIEGVGLRRRTSTPPLSLDCGVCRPDGLEVRGFSDGKSLQGSRPDDPCPR